MFNRTDLKSFHKDLSWIRTMSSILRGGEDKREDERANKSIKS